MEKNELCAVIKHLHMNLTPREIEAELDNVHSTSAPEFATVYNWVNEFKRGRTSICDAPRSGCPIEAATPEIMDKVHDIVLTDRRVKVSELVEATGISHGTVISILHEQLGMKNLSARWMPRLLTVDHKRHRVTISKQCLEMFQCNPNKFLRRLITVDETWIHYFTPETKEQSKQDDELQQLKQSTSTSLKFKNFTLSETASNIYCDTSEEEIKPYIPGPLRRRVFDTVHKDVKEWARICFRYLLTMIDRFTRWSEAISLQDCTANTVTKMFFTHWAARFEAPRLITTDQGSQFELLLELRTCFKEDLSTSVAELVYGTTLKVPGEFFSFEEVPSDPRIFVEDFRVFIQKL
ncbi:SETMR methyltransferase, partial [Acromyrmex heyeri]